MSLVESDSDDDSDRVWLQRFSFNLENTVLVLAVSVWMSQFAHCKMAFEARTLLRSQFLFEVKSNWTPPGRTSTTNCFLAALSPICHFIMDDITPPHRMVPVVSFDLTPGAGQSPQYRGFDCLNQWWVVSKGLTSSAACELAMWNPSLNVRFPDFLSWMICKIPKGDSTVTKLKEP